MIQYPKRYRRIPVRTVESHQPDRLLFENRVLPGWDAGSLASFQQPQRMTRIEPIEPRGEPSTPSSNPNYRSRPPLEAPKPAPVDGVETPQPAQAEPETSDRAKTDWRAVAAELQADMDSFRQRQRRQAQEAAGHERERLLRLLLPIVDNLERALKQDGDSDPSLRQGVELTYREFGRLLAAEGVTRIEAVGQPFDPNLHEALSMQPDRGKPDTVVEEIEAGYQLNGTLLRPARVVVAS